MPLSTEFWGMLSLLIGAVNYIPYFLSIYRGKTKPHAFSWFIWGLLTAIAYFAQSVSGAGPGAWVTGFTAIFCFITFFIALFKGEKNIKKSDWVTFIAALLTIPVWYFTDSPLWATILITLIDGLGFYPTFRKSWHKPYEEDPLTYGLSGLKFVFAVIALDAMTISTALYPISLVLMNFAFVALVMIRRQSYKEGKEHG